MKQDAPISDLDVSRETIDQLNTFVELVHKWTKSINLIAPGSLTDIWTRHILDSAQVYDAAPNGWTSWVDLGSGGGFPGIVVAILDAEDRPVTLVESDVRKSAFLNAARRELGLNVAVRSSRINDFHENDFDVVSARALASLPELMPYARRLLKQGGTAIFPKGRRYQEELDQARIDWQFDVNTVQSTTSPDSRILKISRISRREY